MEILVLHSKIVRCIIARFFETFPDKYRIIRRFFPKGKSLSAVTQKDCDKAAAAINSMPRKILGYRSDAELFEQELANLPATP